MTKSSEPIAIGTFDFDAETGTLSGPEGDTTLRHQSARVLSELLEHRSAVVTKSALIEAVWPDTHVTDDSLVQCISEIRKALGDGARLIVTIPKKGYRLLPQPELLQQPETRSATNAAVKPKANRLKFNAALAVIIIGVAAWLLRPDGTPDTPVTVAVMPFNNMSGNEDQIYFSNGISEDLITSLSSLSDLRVLSRGTSFSMADPDRDPRDLAIDLRADVILEGSVRRVGNTLRISAALVDGDTGANLWAERYDGTPENVFAFQEDVLEQLTRVLSVRLSKAERERLGVRGTENVAAHDAYLRGRELENLYTPDTNLAAEKALRNALLHDPDFALAHAHLSQVYSFRVENNWTQERAFYIDAAFRAAERAVALDPKLPFARFALGRLYTRSYSPDAQKAKAAYEEAIRLDPNYVDAQVFLANVFIFNGEAEKALPLVVDALERHPIPPFWYHLAKGMAHYSLGEYAAAEVALTVARDQNPTAPFSHRFLIATLGQMGRVDDADWAAMEYESLGRRATVTALLDSASIQDAAYRAAFAEGFRAAGLPEN